MKRKHTCLISSRRSRDSICIDNVEVVLQQNSWNRVPFILFSSEAHDDATNCSDGFSKVKNGVSDSCGYEPWTHLYFTDDKTRELLFDHDERRRLRQTNATAKAAKGCSKAAQRAAAKAAQKAAAKGPQKPPQQQQQRPCISLDCIVD